MRGEQPAASAVFDLEVAGGVRRQASACKIGQRRGGPALVDPGAMPLQSARHRLRVARRRRWRHALTEHDATGPARAVQVPLSAPAAGSRRGLKAVSVASTVCREPAQGTSRGRPSA